MFHAMLICTDDDCDETFEAWGTLEELEALACDCGCTLQVLTLDECEELDGTRLELQLVS